MAVDDRLNYCMFSDTLQALISERKFISLQHHFLCVQFITWMNGRQQCTVLSYTDKKENTIFLIYKEIQSGVVAKSYMRKGFL